jgi:assimilatory nitrate reductase catalytic subunit
MERTVSRVRPATETPAGVRTDLAIVAAVGTRVAPEVFPDPSPAPEAVFDEFRALTAGSDADCSGISYDRLDRELAVRWPAPDPESAGGYRYCERDDGGDGSEGGEVTGWSFPTPTGRARFSGDVPAGSLPEPTGAEYPLVLTTGREADGYNTGVRSRDGPRARSESGSEPESGPIRGRVHPETYARFADATQAESAGPRTVLATRRGSVETHLDLDGSVPEGVVWLPIHHPATNRLTHPATDPLSDEPNLKQCAVRFEAPDAERGDGSERAADREVPADD